jgi:mono/diheme cytochrome c family protein
MKNSIPVRLSPCLSLFVMCVLIVSVAIADAADNSNPPFKLTQLKKVEIKAGIPAKIVAAYDPKNPYNIFINYELGMHCVGFDISYCCVIPPYNSVQAQPVMSGSKGKKPKLLSPDDGVKLYYYIRDNSYSEGNKMKFWQVAKDVNGNGKMGDPGDNMANYVWDHLFIYTDLKGTLPTDWQKEKRLYVGKEIQVKVDSGPTGKIISGEYMDYAPDKGGNIVFTDSMIPDVKNVPLKLTASYIWDALGLPLTAFNDSRRKGSIRTITSMDFQPYQYSTVELRDKNGKPVTTAKGKKVMFFGTNPIDIPNCYLCHSAEGKAAVLARKEGLSLFDKEFSYWKKNYPDMTDYMAQLSSASINVLELHDKMNGTTLLKDYGPDAPFNRLGNTGAVYCADCHGDNISGNLRSPRPGATGYKAVKGLPLTEAIHSVHTRAVPMPDKAGRTQSCQACHPTHWQPEEMNDFAKNPYQIIDEEGNPRFSEKDLRTAGGGCYLRRDAHTNPDVKPPFFLNEIGKWYLREVSMKDENRKPEAGMRGLYCTNCHNHLAQELYQYDNLRDSTSQKGKTLRNKSFEEILKATANGDRKKFDEYFADPVVGAEGDPLYTYTADHKGVTLVKAEKDSEGKLHLLPWNADKGDPVPYDAAAAGKDWWLAPSEPHCADCHIAPLVESEGGGYFPIDQPNKYSLYRYSKAHGVIACQSCHESIHELYPVRYEGPKKSVDLTTHEQALQFSPDGKYAGPVTCAACHTVNKKGVPVQLEGSAYYNDYWASVVLLHFMRDGDEKLPGAELLKKFPYDRSRKIVEQGWK